ILNAMPYSFLDDAPLEERRARAVMSRRVLEPAIADTLGALDPEAVARVRDEAWPAPESAEELHETLLWMGYATGEEVAASGWSEWLDELRAAGRVAREGNGGETRWFAAEASREPRAILRGRMEALGPVFVADGAGPAAVPDGGARAGAVPAAHAGPRGGPEPPTVAPSDEPVLVARLHDYRPEWLDQLTLSGEVAWGRLWGEGDAPARSSPICLLPREDLETWLALARAVAAARSGDGGEIGRGLVVAGAARGG